MWHSDKNGEISRKPGNTLTIFGVKGLAMIAVLLLAVAPVDAQVGTSNAQEQLEVQQQIEGQSGRSASSQAAATGAATTGVTCEEEMTATFCNVPTAPNNGGYGNGSVTVGSSAPPASIPPCPEFPPANELCN